jgi:mannose-6-phosphate isomerase
MRAPSGQGRWHPIGRVCGQTEQVQTVEGVVQHYAWGDRSFIPRLLGTSPDGRPWAELWLGTHPAAPAVVDDGRPLRDLTGELPYLLKVLAAAEPLSLQTHPTAARARAGFAHEQAIGIPVDAPERVYKDPHPKPELIVALEDFDALCGFRPVEATVELLRAHGIAALADRLDGDGLPAVVTGLLHGEIDAGPLVDACARAQGPEPQLVVDLAVRHPGDPSAAITLLLNRVTLAPGEALYLAPGTLHAYVGGAGVEVMGPSDNVVRGGLTAKHVDVDELIAVLDVSPLEDPIVRPVEPSTSYRHELVLCTAGTLGSLSSGEAVYVAPGEHVTFHGRGTVFRVEDTAFGH